MFNTKNEMKDWIEENLGLNFINEMKEKDVDFIIDSIVSELEIEFYSEEENEKFTEIANHIIELNDGEL